MIRYEDSQVVLALHSPHKFKQTTYKRYNIKELEQVFLAMFLLKSRFGTSDILVPLGYYGDCSTFIELPRPDNIAGYERYKTPYWSKESAIKDVRKEETDTSSSDNFKFTL